MLKQVLLVLSCCVLVTVRAQQPCLGAPAHLPHSFVAAPESCNAYILCMGGQTIRGQTCPVDMLFDPLTQTCGHSSCDQCSPFGIQNLPHLTDCAQFIRCTMGTREFATCPDGLLFDRTISNCNYAHLVYCPGQPTEPPTDWPPPDTTTPCPPEWTTDPWITDPWTPDPWPPTTQPPDGDRPVCRGQVFHAHPTDCNRYFICVNEVLWEHNCPNSLHWNQLRNACDLPERAGCIARPTGQPPTDWPPTDWPPTEPPLLPPSTSPPFYDEDEPENLED